MRFAIFAFLFSFAAISSAPSSCAVPAEPWLKLTSGRWVCAVHRVPEVDGYAFWLPGDLPTIDFMGYMARVSASNPNSLYPYASLHRTKEFRVRGPAKYCPVCERAMVAAAARAETYFKKHGGYKP
jgi:hypothetical protein